MIDRAGIGWSFGRGTSAFSDDAAAEVEGIAGVSAALRERLERWLAAHLALAGLGPRVRSVLAGDLAEDYKGMMYYRTIPRGRQAFL